MWGVVVGDVCNMYVPVHIVGLDETAADPTVLISIRHATNNENLE